MHCVHQFSHVRLLSSDAYNAILFLRDGEWIVESLDKLPEGTQPQISVEELIACEEIIRKDETVRKLASDVGEHFPAVLSDLLCHVDRRPSRTAACRWLVDRIRRSISTFETHTTGILVCSIF